MPRLSPRRATYVVAALFAFAFMYDLMRVPIQVSDSLVELLDVQQSPSLYATAVATAQRGAYLRPLRLAQIKALFDIANGNYWLVYRGFHALLLAAALFLFARALRVHRWTECAAGAFALTVLTGMHTFRGTVREAFPINHFLEIMVFCLVAINLAQSRPRWWIDVMAAATFVVASLTLESGLLVWVILVVAWACGMRGVSRRGLIVVTALFGSYFLLRFYFSNGTPSFVERSSGFLIRILEPEELEQRFGANPIWYYAYNVITSIVSVLFSDPDGGVFEIARAWLQGDVPPRLYVGLASSILATALIAWAIVARLRGQAGAWPSGGDQLLVIFGAVLVANAAMSYAYTKHEIMSVAGAFYGLAAYVAGCYLLEWMHTVRKGRRSVAIVVVLVTSSLWAFRSAGVHHMFQQQAFKQRNDWVHVPPPANASSPDGKRAVALIQELRHEALEMRISNPYLLPRWMDRWWGE